MRRLSQIVNYDLQRNTFYKVNKFTGEQQLSYKNGDALKKFRPDVTGRHYLIRKSIDAGTPTAHQHTFSEATRQRSINTQRTLYDTFLFKTLDPLRRDTKHTQTSLMATTLSPRNSPKLTFDEKNQPSLKREVDESVLSREKSKEKVTKQQLNQTLTSYSKLLKQKQRDNKSPKRDSYPGSEPAKDPLATLCTTLSHFKRREPEWDNGSKTQRVVAECGGLGEEYSPKGRTKQERALFLQFHPELRVKQNPKGVQVQTQRKRNLKILQQLFIRQNNRSTRKAYQSIA